MADLQSEDANDPQTEKRKGVRKRYYNEAALVLRELVPELQKIAADKGIALTVNFDVNAAAASVVIEMGKRGCA